MTEQTIAILERPISTIDPLPTTLEIAQRGAQAYHQVVATLPSTLKESLEDIRVKACFTGITPEYGGGVGSFLDKLTRVELANLIECLNSFAPQMGIIARPILPSYVFRRSLINLEAAKHVVENNPDAFTREAISYPQTWIMTQPELWRSNNPQKSHYPEARIRYGLLSGFPRRATQKFNPYKTVHDRVMASRVIEDEKEFVELYRINPASQNPQKRAQMADILARVSFLRLTTEERRLMLDAHTVKYWGDTPMFIGFDHGHDEEYAEAVEEIHRNSGIEIAC